MMYKLLQRLKVVKDLKVTDKIRIPYSSNDYVSIDFYLDIEPSETNWCCVLIDKEDIPHKVALRYPKFSEELKRAEALKTWKEIVRASEPPGSVRVTLRESEMAPHVTCAGSMSREEAVNWIRDISKEYMKKVPREMRDRRIQNQ